MEVQQDEKQQELFLEFSGEAKRPDRFPSLAKTHKPILLNTTIEQIILGGIALILTGCFVFFLGVLRGKFLSTHEPAQLSQRRTAAPAFTAAAIPAPVTTQKLEVRPVMAAAPAGTQGAEQARNPAKPYTIQISSYKKRDLAEQEAVMLRRRGLYSTVIASTGRYAVCVGQYATGDAAKKDLKAYKAANRDCYLRRQS